MWIMDRLFKFTNFGIVSVIHQDFFIMSVSYLILNRKFREKSVVFHLVVNRRTLIIYYVSIVIATVLNLDLGSMRI